MEDKVKIEVTEAEAEFLSMLLQKEINTAHTEEYQKIVSDLLTKMKGSIQ